MTFAPKSRLCKAILYNVQYVVHYLGSCYP